MNRSTDRPARRPADPAPPQHYELDVHPEAPDSPWHATLRERGQSGGAEFDSPLQLLRHLARLTLMERQGGLR